MLTCKTQIDYKSLEHVTEFDTTNIPLELIQLDLDRFLTTLNNVGLYNACKNSTFIFIQTDIVAKLYEAIVSFVNREAIVYVNRSKRLPNPLPAKCENIKDILYYSKDRCGMGNTIQYIIRIYNKVQRLLTLNSYELTTKDNKLTIKIQAVIERKR